MKIERHDQAKILTQEKIGLLFNKGLLSSRARAMGFISQENQPKPRKST
jgi:hypothetical protein